MQDKEDIMYEEGTKFIVIELQKNEDGTLGNFVWAFDDENQAESKYHSVLALAAVSSIPKHSVVLMHEEGFVIKYETYTHDEEKIV